MVIYAVALATVILFPSVGVYIIWRAYGGEGAFSRISAANASCSEIQPVAGDFSAFDANAIEGEYHRG